jgi:hypothetical protein
MVIGIDLSMIVYVPGKDITDEEALRFNYEFVDLVESFGWYCGGGQHGVNVDQERDCKPKWKMLIIREGE